MTSHRRYWGQSWTARLRPDQLAAERRAARERMAALRASRRKAQERATSAIPAYVPGPRAAVDPAPTPLPAPPLVDRAYEWVRPPTEADREVLQRMLAIAESDGRRLAAASIRARIAELGTP